MRITTEGTENTENLISSRLSVPSVFSVVILAFSIFTSIHSLAADTAKPNIVVLLADDLGWGDLGIHGGEISTPHIDALAKSGVELSSFYVQPVCTQTRAAFLTGRYPFRYGLARKVISPKSKRGLPTEERTLAEALKEVGYQTAIIGKWHLGHASPEFLPNAQGFDKHVGNYCGWVDYYTRERSEYKNHDGHSVDWHQDGKPHNPEGYTTDLIVEETATFIDQQKSKQPFFLYVAFTAPHGPLAAPKSHFERNKHIKNKMRREYAAVVTAFDDAIGRVVKKIDQAGLRDNTIIVFSSDNGAKKDGGGSNLPFRGYKKELYEGSLRVPTFISWPAELKAGAKNESLLHVVDLFPTLIEVAGGTTQKTIPVDGVSFLNDIKKGTTLAREDFFYANTDVGIALRSGDFKLIEFHKSGKQELFDLAKDPEEKRNLIEQRQKEAKRIALRFSEFQEVDGAK